jgi:hypothetical protein
VKRRLTALLPLWPTLAAALAEARVARRSVPCSANGASSDTPPGTAFSAVREASKAASDTLCRARADPSLRTSPPRCQDRRLRSSRQRGRRASIQRAFPPPMAPSAPACAGVSGAARRLPAIETIHERDCLDHTEPDPYARGHPRPPGGMAAALLRAPPVGASRSRGPGAALAASASSRQCLEELPRNRSLPSTSSHEPVPPPAGEPTACGVAAAWNAPTRGTRLRRSPRRTPRTARAGALAQGLRLVRITYGGSSAVPPPRRGSPARCTRGAFRPMKRTRSAPGLPTDCHQPVE